MKIYPAKSYLLVLLCSLGLSTLGCGDPGSNNSGPVGVAPVATPGTDGVNPTNPTPPVTDTTPTDPSQPGTPSDPGETTAPQPAPTGDPCIDGVIVSSVVDVVFDAQDNGCPWAQGDNLGEYQRVLTARRETEGRLFDTSTGYPYDWISQGAVLCDVRLDSLELDPEAGDQEFKYDDDMALVVNDIVLLTSNSSFLDLLETDGSLYLWNWEAVRGMELDFNGNGWCLGYDDNATECALPSSNQSGIIVASFAGPTFQQARTRILSQNAFQMRLVATGDNDNGDCMHDQYKMRVVLDVAVPDSW